MKLAPVTPSSNPASLQPAETFETAKLSQDEIASVGLPPHSEEAEEGVLACCLLDPTECIHAAMARCIPESFYDLRRRTLWNCLVAMSEAHQPVDSITVQARLRATGALGDAGGIEYVFGLQDKIPSASNLPEYLKIIREKLLLRKLMALCSTTTTALHGTSSTPDEIINQFEEEALRIRDTQVQERPNKEVMVEFIASLQAEMSGTSPTRIHTGIYEFDKRFTGYKRGNMVVIAARPSMGKTAYMLEVARNMARARKIGVFSLEMVHEELIGRLVSAEAGVNLDPRHLRYIQEGNDTESFQRITQASAIVSKLPIHIVDKSGMSIQQIRAHARRWVRKHGIEVIMVDYMQLVTGSSKRARDDRRLEIAEISKGCKEMAKELNIVVIVLSQLNRSVEQRGESSRPRMADIREAGEIEQDADWIQFLWSKIPLDEQKDQQNPEIVVSVAKNRNGPTGDVQLRFRKDCGRFECMTLDGCEEEERPRHKN